MKEEGLGKRELTCSVVETEASGGLMGVLELGWPFRVVLGEVREVWTLYPPLSSH